MLKLPVTYLTKLERNMGGSVMVPGMPVSDGMLSDIEYRLGEVEGRPAILTSLTINENHIGVIGSRRWPAEERDDMAVPAEAGLQESHEVLGALCLGHCRADGP